MPGAAKRGDVYRAVVSGKNADEVLRAIEASGRTPARRIAAVNEPGGPPGDEMTPIVWAVHHGTTDGARVLLDNGAVWPSLLSAQAQPPAMRLTLSMCIAHNAVAGARAALREAPALVHARLPYRPSGGWATVLGARFGPDEDVERETRGLRRRIGEHLSDATFWCTHLHMTLEPMRDEIGIDLPPQLEILTMLVREFCADVNAQDSEGNTLAHWLTVQCGRHEETLELLLRLGLDINRAAKDRHTALMQMSNERDLLCGYEGAPKKAVFRSEPVVACVRAMLAAGARAAGVFDVNGLSALSCAAKRGHPEVVRLLLEEGGVPANETNPRTGATALHTCCPAAKYYSLAPVAELLLVGGGGDGGGGSNNKIDPRARDKGGATLVHACALRGDVDTLRLLIERGGAGGVADDCALLDKRGMTPLLLACEGHGEYDPCDTPEFVVAILRATPRAARRAVRPSDGRSAIDLLLERKTPAAALSRKEAWFAGVVRRLLAAGCPYAKRNAKAVRAIEAEPEGAVAAAAAAAAAGRQVG